MSVGGEPERATRPRWPFHELAAGFASQEAEVRAAFERVLHGGRYILGPEVAAFEREFAGWLGMPHAIGVANATEALQLALVAAGVRPGDEVVVPALTAAPTAMAVLAAGAVPVLADVDEETLTLDPQAAAAALSPRTAAIVPVHLYGHCADVDALRDVIHACGRPLALVEDAAQAHGAQDGGRYAGTLGDAGIFSFYPTKNLGAMGDGGAIVTRDAERAARLRRLRTYGGVEGYDFTEAGINSRLDELQAAILRVRLGALEAGNERRRAHARAYGEVLAGGPIRPPAERQGCRHVFHQYVVRCARRDALRAHLAARGIETLIHYPRALSRMTVLRTAARIPRVPEVAERAVGEILSLPIHPELPAGQLDAVREALAAFPG